MREKSTLVKFQVFSVFFLSQLDQFITNFT